MMIVSTRWPESRLCNFHICIINDLVVVGRELSTVCYMVGVRWWGGVFIGVGEKHNDGLSASPCIKKT